MKATKKLFALILAAAMALSLAACGSGGTTETIANAAPGTAEKTVSNKHYDITLGTAGTTGTYYVVGAAIANAVNNVAPNLTVVAQATNGSPATWKWALPMLTQPTGPATAAVPVFIPAMPIPVM